MSVTLVKLFDFCKATTEKTKISERKKINFCNLPRNAKRTLAITVYISVVAMQP